MKIFPTNRVKDIDAYTIENEPIHSVQLMERAANQLKQWVVQHIDCNRPVKMIAGPGNNGGDTLALARLLKQEGYQVAVWLVRFTNKMSEDAIMNFNRLSAFEEVPVQYIEKEEDLPRFYTSNVVIEGIFGSGLSRPVEGLPASVIKHINASPAEVISIDVPSGLFGEDNSTNFPETIIQATYTLTLQFPKIAFFCRENEKYTGTWYVLPIGLHPEIIKETPTPYYYINKEHVQSWRQKRRKFSHKGTYGHSVLISGSYGKMGAAVMASEACLRTGVGLHTCHVPANGCEILQTALPESMVSIDNSNRQFEAVPDLSVYTAVGVGPGIGTSEETRQAFDHLLKTVKQPLVIDADGLNILANNQAWLQNLPEFTILTPHPKEFDRLAGESSTDYERIERGRSFAQRYGVVLVLKGAFTRVIDAKGYCYFNSTGTPGMATAGSGDVLTGMILSLLAQGYDTLKAALLGVYVHGCAGEFACSALGEETMMAGDIIKHIGRAFHSLSNCK